ncbi:hypothetical protein V1504DRAFT_455863 [Lipomyces starkeyi]
MNQVSEGFLQCQASEKYLVDPGDEERGYVQFNFGDEAVLLINNFGGLSSLETRALTYQTIVALGMYSNYEALKPFAICLISLHLNRPLLLRPLWIISIFPPPLLNGHVHTHRRDHTVSETHSSDTSKMSYTQFYS